MNPITNSVIKGIDKLASSKLAERLRKLNINNPDKFIVASAITSVVAKDAVGCYYYTTQSLNNKKIPEEKRKFVASLDLVNGGLMILSQLTLGLLVDKKTDSWFNKTVGKWFKQINIEQLFNKLKLNIPELTMKALTKSVEKLERISKTGFKLLIPLVASAIVAKRMIVPLIATPLAGKVKEKFMDKQQGSVDDPTKKSDTC